MVNLTGVTSATTSTATAAGNAGAKLADDFDDFLSLLTTQLQNQDPMDPMDSNQFTQQLVAFSGVEQQIRTNQNLESMASLLQLSNVASAAGYLGNEALIPGNLGDHDGTSGIKWKYQNTAATDELKLEVRKTDGTLVYSQDGEKGLGLQDFNWTGVDAAGNPVAPGNYKLTIVAKDADGGKLNPPIAVQETITAVDMSGTEPIFTVGPNEVAQTKILQLLQ